MNANFERILLTQETTLQEAALHLEQNDLSSNSRVVLYVVDSERRLIGSVMDVDIRRAIMQKDLSPHTKVTQIMNPSPRKIIKEKKANLDAQDWRRFQHIPIVDQNGILIDFKENHEIYNFPNKVIIMAGGLGMRLRPLTNEIPKPMLKLAGKPILQEIIESFKIKGFLDFFISVNYKAHVIKDYFGDGRKFDIKITYLEEKEKLGTCGSIKLAERFLHEEFFVINGDILANIDYEQLLLHHKNQNNNITLCTFPYSYTIPYGVIESQQNSMSILEKPTFTHQINCGVYVLDPTLLSLVRDDEPLDMPTLIQQAINRGFKIGTFVIDEWIDIGNLEDFYRAQNKANFPKEQS